MQAMDADSHDAQQPGPDSIMTGMLEVADAVHDCDRFASVRFACLLNPCFCARSVSLSLP
jgi:hypothetical protein